MAKLQIVLTDAAGRSLHDHVIVDLYSIQSSTRLQAVGDVSGSLVINEIDISGGPLYRVMVTPANYRPVQNFVSLSEAQVTTFTALVPIDPAKVAGITGPAFSRLPVQAQRMLASAAIPPLNDGKGGFLQGAALYSALDPAPLLKACFLNIVAKSAATRLPDASSVIDHFSGLVRIEQDRLFLRTSAALLEESTTSSAFHSVSAALHEPLPGYQIVSSVKTFDRYGNLQLTFQRRGNTGSDYAVDVDIDDAQGVEHIFQVVRNSVSGPTNPYDIHDILLQQTPAVDPGFTFVFAARAKV